VALLGVYYFGAPWFWFILVLSFGKYFHRDPIEPKLLGQIQEDSRENILP
jgi:hypothetical protein